MFVCVCVCVHVCVCACALSSMDIEPLKKKGQSTIQRNNLNSWSVVWTSLLKCVSVGENKHFFIEIQF